MTSKIQPVKPCFQYPGGKSALLKFILPAIPAHQTYAEPFAGGLALLLAKERAKVEVVNDRNSEIANFYRYVKFHGQALIDELAGYLHSRENFSLLKSNPGQTDLQRAARWYLLKVCSFGGYSDAFARGRGSYRGFDRPRHFALIEAVGERLNKVYIESKDWEEVAEFWDGPDTLFYFDPPYVNADPGAAYDAFPEFEMERVRRRLDKLQGRWLLSCDDSPPCRRIFSGLPFERIPIRYSSRKRAGMKTPLSHELLVRSPSLSAAKAA